MKHRDQGLADLCTLAAELGTVLEPSDAEELLSHLEWVLEVNQVHNLTAVRDLSTGIRLHLIDSISALPDVEQAPAGEMLDIGTGGGFPGLPLAVLTSRAVTLLDSVGKKVRLVGEYAEQRGLHVHIAPFRAEDFAKEMPNSFAVVLARAVSQLPSIIELAAPLLAKGGRFVALKGPLSEEELFRGDQAAKMCGLRRVSLRRITLPGGDECRTLISYEKIARPALALPRRVGLAQKQPLA